MRHYVIFFNASWVDVQLYVYGVHPGELQVAISPLCKPSLSANCRCSDDPWVHDSGET